MITDTQGVALLSCPFCGGAPKTRRFVEEYQADSDGPAGEYDAQYFICCDECGIEQREEYRDDAIAAWNRRARHGAEPVKAELATLRAEVARLTEENETYRTAFDGIEPARLKAQPGLVKALEELAQRIDADGTASQIGSAEEIREILAALAAPVSQEPVAFWCHDFHVARQPVKARGKFEEPTEDFYPANREQHARDMARIMGGECTPLYAAPQPTEGEPSDAEVERALAAWEAVYIAEIEIGQPTFTDNRTDAMRAALLAAKSKGGEADG